MNDAANICSGKITTVLVNTLYRGDCAMIGWIVVLIVLGFWLVLGLFSYVLFRPYADTLPQKLAANMTGVPGLFAFFLPPLKNQRPEMIPVYFVSTAVLLAVTTIAFHFLERWYRRP